MKNILFLVCLIISVNLLADLKKMKKKPDFATPQSVMKKMAQRADAIVLPSLNAAAAKKKKEELNTNTNINI